MDDGVLVSLAAGVIACVRAPIELHAASRPTTNEDLMLGPPHVSTQVRACCTGPAPASTCVCARRGLHTPAQLLLAHMGAVLCMRLP